MRPGRTGRKRQLTSVSAGQINVWSPPPESNRRPHPYHRCAGGSRRYAAPHVATQPRRWEGASKSGNVGQREDACSAVSGKFLARAPAQSSGHQRRRHRPDSPRPQASGTSGALLSSDDCGWSVERTGRLHPLWQRAFEIGTAVEVERRRSGLRWGSAGEQLKSRCVA